MMQSSQPMQQPFEKSQPGNFFLTGIDQWAERGAIRPAAPHTICKLADSVSMSLNVIFFIWNFQ